MIIEYKRTPAGPWVTIPRTTARSAWRFILLGQWYAYRELVGEVTNVVVNTRAA